LNALDISNGPHIRGKNNTTLIMLTVLIALLPVVVYSIYLFELNAFFIILSSVLTCVLCELAYNLFTKKFTVLDLSSVVTGVILALTLPPTVPLFVPIIGSVFAIFFCKLIFGGIGKNIVNPAATARVFLTATFPALMAGQVWKDMFNVTTATVLPSINAGNFAGNAECASMLDLLFGTQAGSLGETCAIMIIVIGIILCAIKFIDWVIPVSILASSALFALICGGASSVLPHLLSGGLLFGAVFMATDYTTSPRSNVGKIVYGVIIGGLTILVRCYGSYPEGVSMAIVLANLLVPALNKLNIKTTFGRFAKFKQQRFEKKQAKLASIKEGK